MKLKILINGIEATDWTITNTDKINEYISKNNDKLVKTSNGYIYEFTNSNNEKITHIIENI